jgi:hypothetical protein
MRALILLVGLCLLSGCRVGSPRETLRIDVQVSDDRGDPLAEVPVLVDEAHAKATDAQGKVSLTVSAALDRRLRIRADCPEAYRPSEPRTVTTAGSALLELRFQCRPRLRTLAVVIHAPDGAGLTARADGEPIGKVAADGTLHAVLKRPPEAELRLTLDTSTAPLLRPQSPIQDVLVPDRDEIVVFDQPFTLAAPRRARGPARGPAPEPKVEPRHIPYAIGRR